jgi:mannose-6-phosphate isomerase-like protein (cupin superfamily)
VEDAAPRLGIDAWQETRFAGADLDTRRTGFTHHRITPGTRQGFGHRHEREEEIYVVLSGSGRVKLGDDIVDVAPLDALRVDPEVLRSWEGGPEGLELLVFGPKDEGDAEFVQGWWTD